LLQREQFSAKEEGGVKVVEKGRGEVVFMGVRLVFV
jgi:hypothetical protein